MKKSLISAAVLSGALLSSAVFACEAPETRPEIPDPTSAVTAQMVAANNQVREYVSAMETYLSCARLSAAQLRREESALREFAESFNEAIRTFRLASN
ncbi:fimbrial protein [Marinimicrobium alkaliphilum]|uniref:hypothetical protein n=1 Tax=Marinimicrobium alkaliphilum TaxID=2202654 RepID=UPI000DBA12F9|nr:hypothetical protein [Marinimicrobium alkaliphilum]